MTIGFVKDAKHHVDVQGFNVYHKNRLIKVSVSFCLLFYTLSLKNLAKIRSTLHFRLISSQLFFSHFGGYGMQQEVMVVGS